MQYYEFVAANTGEIVAWTRIGASDIGADDITAEDLVEVRLEAAIQDGYLPDQSYEWDEIFRSSARNFAKDLQEI